MSMLDAVLPDVATLLIQMFGVQATLTRTTVPAYDPLSGVAGVPVVEIIPVTVSPPEDMSTGRMAANAFVSLQVIGCYLDGSVRPLTGDVLTLYGRKYQVTNPQELRSGDLVAAYQIFLE